MHALSLGISISFCLALTSNSTLPIQVLYWAKEEDKMEKLKARLIELYYENLFKVSSLLLFVNCAAYFKVLLSPITNCSFHSARYTCRRIERMAGCCSDSRYTLCCRVIPWQEMHDRSFGSDGTKQIFQGDLSYRLSFLSLLNYCCLKSMLLSKVHFIHFSGWLQAIVTDEDDMESIANRFLSAAMKACSCPTTSRHTLC